VTYIGKLGYKDEINEGEQDAIITTLTFGKRCNRFSGETAALAVSKRETNSVRCSKESCDVLAVTVR
jgi:hypothetical protein